MTPFRVGALVVTAVALSCAALVAAGKAAWRAVARR